MEFIAMIGVVGAVLSAFVSLTTETDKIRILFDPDGNGDCSRGQMVGLVSTFCLTLFLHMVGVAYFVLFSESALVNMCLLTGNFWAIGFSIVFQDIAPDPVFYVALFLIILGIVIYETPPSPIPENQTTVIQQLPTTEAGAQALIDANTGVRSLTTSTSSLVMGDPVD